MIMNDAPKGVVRCQRPTGVLTLLGSGCRQAGKWPITGGRGAHPHLGVALVFD